MLVDENKRKFLVVAYEHVTKCVANVKNDTYMPDNPSLRTEYSKCHMICHAFFHEKCLHFLEGSPSSSVG